MTGHNPLSADHEATMRRVFDEPDPQPWPAVDIRTKSHDCDEAHGGSCSQCCRQLADDVCDGCVTAFYELAE